MADREAAERLAKVLRVAMAQAGIETWTQLALVANISPTTVDNWIYGRTTPRAHHLNKVALVLRPYTSAGALERAYQGLPPEEVPLHEQIKELVAWLSVLVPALSDAAAAITATADQALLEEIRAQLRARMRRAREQPDAPPPALSGGDEPPPRDP